MLETLLHAHHILITEKNSFKIVPCGARLYASGIFFLINIYYLTIILHIFSHMLQRSPKLPSGEPNPRTEPVSNVYKANRRRTL